MNQPVELRPVQGALGIARALAHRAGLGALWDGEDGIGQVLRENIAERPIQLTPRAALEGAGLVKPKRRRK